MVMEMCAEEEKNRGVKRHAAYQRPMTMTKLTPSPAASPREEREGTGGLGGRRLIFSRHSAPTLSQGAAPSGAGKSPMALSPGDPLPSPSSQMMPSSASGLPESVRGARPFVSPLSGVSSSRLAEDETRRGRALLNQAIKDRASTTTSPPRKTLEEPKRRRVEAEGGTGTHTAELPSASSAAAAVPSANPPTGSVSLRLPEGESSQSFPQLLRSGSAASEQGSPASQSSDPLNFTWGGDILDFQAGTKPVTVKEGGTKRKWKEDEKEKGGGGGSA
uniref:Uncharacterized protein n=1 Tax=Chromera velia CCMP2878 TaxID=1169474 RepID=A0A0G4FFN0_9ALVE|eukprot:Cvel_16679.t1-p1 / transcript=Cvel_16679.t1 / gene=Cvel_16679 / organism=Chromera_velia_CCMP2878 / gene_product=hypothetical protein / transcript_product=hypothetical protein / location=Cvel_scaffold1295:176-1531(+) / protein_length=274 / sequence_SO=supercontig / SO=protein_coding / is_pseudo=false